MEALLGNGNNFGGGCSELVIDYWSCEDRHQTLMSDFPWYLRTVSKLITGASHHRLNRFEPQTTVGVLKVPFSSQDICVRTDLANRPTEPMLVSLRARYTKLLGNRGFLQSGSRQTTPVRVGVTCGSGISVVRVERK